MRRKGKFSSMETGAVIVNILNWTKQANIHVQQK